MAWAIGFALVATLVPPAAMTPGPSGQDVALATPPAVTDPRPAPGSVVDAGPVVLAARVVDADPDEMTILVDGEPAAGVPVDPDGSLTALDGVEVTLGPGTHTVGVSVGQHGVLREWEVTAVAMDVQVAEEDAAGLIRRFRSTSPGISTVVLVGVDRPQVSVAAAPLAAALDATVLPTDRRVVPAETWAALRRAGGPTEQEILLLGGSDHIDVMVEQALTTAGFATRRIDGATAGAVAAAAMDEIAARADTAGTGVGALVVVPAEPFEVAVQGAVAATRLGAGVVLASDELDDATAAVIGRHESVLVSSALSPTARQGVIDALSPTAAISDDALRPPAAVDAVIIADGAGPDRLLGASLAATPGRAVLIGTESASTWVGEHRPDRITIVAEPPPAADPAGQGTADVDLVMRDLRELAHLPALDVNAPAVGRSPDAADVADVLREAWVDGPEPLEVVALIDRTDGLRIALSAPDPVTHATVHVTVFGYEWPGSTSIEGLDVIWTGADRPALPLPLEPSGPDQPTPVVATVRVITDGRTAHEVVTTDVPLTPLPMTSSEGWTVAGGSTGVTGHDGRVYTYSVEIEPSTGLDIHEVEAEITRVLTDPRSWTADGRVSFQRVGTSRARLRVVVATPATVDAYCGAVGLRTGGRVSCWDGFRAMLNLDRWTVGVPHFGGDLVTYREYLINHEVGHGLGHGHVGCPRPRMLAPVMMQQTGSVGACQPNGWPFP